jgi:hypothetical protein
VLKVESLDGVAPEPTRISPSLSKLGQARICRKPPKLHVEKPPSSCLSRHLELVNGLQATLQNGKNTHFAVSFTFLTVLVHAVPLQVAG